MAELPNGRIKTAITGGMEETRKWTYPVVFGLWAIIFLLPWAAWFGSEGAPPLALGAVQKLMAIGQAPFPWLSILITLIMAGLAYAMVQGASDNLDDPAGHPAFAPLIEAGTDHFEAVRQFEDAIASGAYQESGGVTATPSWLFINRPGTDMALIPVSAISWMYFRRPVADAVVNKAFKEAGIINSRQASLVEAFADPEILVIHTSDRSPAVEFEYAPGQAQELLAYLLASNPKIIVGWSKELKAFWSRDRLAFADNALAHQALKTEASPRESAHEFKIADLVEQAASMLERMKE